MKSHFSAVQIVVKWINKIDHNIKSSDFQDSQQLNKKQVWLTIQKYNRSIPKRISHYRAIINRN